MTAAVVGFWVAMAFDPVVRVVTTVDVAVLEVLADLRTDAVTTLARGIHALGSVWVFRALVWGALAVLVVFRRLSHLVALFVVVLVVTAVDAAVAVGVGRMRPSGLEILGRWEGYAHPSRPVAGLALGLVAALYVLVPAGPWRNRSAAAGAALVALLAAARLYLGVDHPTDVAAAVVTGSALPAAAFRLLLPDDVFPVNYRRGRRAHLDIGGRRGQAIARALDAQLGIPVRSIESFALSGSAGSTPICIHTAAGGRLFGKVYATVHLRSDRLYKLGRTVRYGRLEDEHPFNTVRRLVQYEDHMLRFMHDAGLPTPRPLGIAEITPEREYVIVTEFLEGAEQIADVDVDDAVMDSALAAVRRLWDAGLAHRDIKPANLLVRGSDVFLIDVAFGEVRPSPWRQAVDLANMMLTLALCSTPEKVYERALRQFSPDEIAEAFAASRSITIPAQLRAALRADGRDLAGRFRALAPSRTPVTIQRWSLRRVGLTLGLLLALVAALVALVANLQLAGLL